MNPPHSATLSGRALATPGNPATTLLQHSRPAAPLPCPSPSPERTISDFALALDYSPNLSGGTSKLGGRVLTTLRWFEEKVLVILITVVEKDTERPKDQSKTTKLVSRFWWHSLASSSDTQCTPQPAMLTQSTPKPNKAQYTHHPHVLFISPLILFCH